MYYGAARGRVWTRAGGSPLRRLLEDASEFGEGTSIGASGTDELRWATQPYAERRVSQPLPSTDPRHTTVLLFPGRGALRSGMGRKTSNLPTATDLYELASSILGWDVWRTCMEGGATLEKRGDACVMVTALAALEHARAERPAAVERARAAAGPGCGELAALVFAGAFTLETALRVLQVRDAAVRAVAAARRAGTLQLWLSPDARLGAAMRAARDAAFERGVPAPVCQVAAYLYPGSKLVAGDEEALAWLETEGPALGVVRAARVKGAPALHTPLMEEAAQAVRAACAAAEVRAPRLPVVCGWSGRTARNAEDVSRAVWRGVAAPLRWEQVLHALYARPAGTPQPQTLVLGPGGALRHTLRQVNARAWDASLHIDV